MNIHEAKALRPGALVRVNTPVMGGVCLSQGGEIEVSWPAGAIARVDFTERPPKAQDVNLRLTLVFDNGIVNSWEDDEVEHLESVEDSPALRRERAAFLLRHSPPDYPAGELMGDLGAIFGADVSGSLDLTPAPPVLAPFRVNLRGVCTATLTVVAKDEAEALEQARRFKGDHEDPALGDTFALDWWEVDGLDD